MGGFTRISKAIVLLAVAIPLVMVMNRPSLSTVACSLQGQWKEPPPYPTPSLSSSSSSSSASFLQPNMDLAAVTTFVEQKHERIGGWFVPAARYGFLLTMRLQVQHGIRGAVGEIGVHRGKLTTFLGALARRDDVDRRQLFVADLFEDLQDLNIDKSGSGDKQLFAQALGLVNLTLNDFVVFTGPSQNVTTSYFVEHQLEPFRLFSVDGGHTKATAFSDLMLMEQHVAEGGVVALDDFNRGDWWGVTEGAVEYDALGQGKLVPFAYLGNKLFYTTPSHVALYKQAFQSDPVLARFAITAPSPARGGPTAMHLFRKCDWYLGGERFSGPEMSDVVEELRRLYDASNQHALK